MSTRPAAGQIEPPSLPAGAELVQAGLPVLAGRCAVSVHGSGPRAVVGLHGWSGSRASFEPLLPLRPPGVRFYAFDLPGSGESEAPGRWTSEAVVDRLLGALDALELERVEVLGVCGGMGFGARLAARAPERVERLVLIDPFVYLPWYLALFTWPLVGGLFYGSTFANPVGRLLTDGVLAGRRTRSTSLTEGFAAARHRDNRGQLIALSDAAKKPLSELGRYRGPVEILYGERTFSAVKESCRRLVAGPYPQASICVVPDAGHLPMHEATAVVAERVFGEAPR